MVRVLGSAFSFRVGALPEGGGGLVPELGGAHAARLAPVAEVLDVGRRQDDPKEKAQGPSQLLRAVKARSPRAAAGLRLRRVEVRDDRHAPHAATPGKLPQLRRAREARLGASLRKCTQPMPERAGFGEGTRRQTATAPSFEIVHQSLCPQTGQGRDLLALCQEGFMVKPKFGSWMTRIAV